MKEIRRLLPLLSFISALIAYFIDKRICYGILLGSVCNWLYLLLLSKTFNGLFEGKIVLLSPFLSSVIRYGLMVLPFLISVLYPDTFHFIGALIGFLLFKVALVLVSL